MSQSSRGNQFRNSILASLVQPSRGNQLPQTDSFPSFSQSLRKIPSFSESLRKLPSLNTSGSLYPSLYPSIPSIPSLKVQSPSTSALASFPQSFQKVQSSNTDDIASPIQEFINKNNLLKISLIICGIILFFGSIWHRVHVVNKIIKNKKIILPIIGEITKKNFYKYKYINTVVLVMSILLILTSMFMINSYK